MFGIQLVDFKENLIPSFSLSMNKHILSDNSDAYVCIGESVINTIIPWMKNKKIILIPQWHKSYVQKNIFTKILNDLLKILFFCTITMTQPKVLCYTQEERLFLKKFVRNIDVMPLGLDLERPLWKLIREVPVHKNPQTVVQMLYVGRVVPHKFPLFLLDAIAIFREKFKGKFIFYVVGPIRMDYFLLLKKKLIDTRLNDYFVFTGGVSEEDLAKYYAESDIFIFPSMSESFGYTIVEALYAGLPIVATRTGVMPDLETMRLATAVNYGDTLDLANKIICSIEETDIIKKKLASMRPQIETLFNIENFMNRLWSMLK